MKAISRSLFAAKHGDPHTSLPLAYERVSAAELNLPESWFRDAIANNPELVIGPCREAGRVPSDETWLLWKQEFADLDAGRVDVLLLSSYGRPAIVETKLSYNPQGRREVVAQVLDYALSLQETPRDALPELPATGPTLADLDDHLAAGKYLLIVAGDSLDPRALRLSQAVLARHLTSEWDLAMIDLNVYRSTAVPEQLLIVPELRGVLLAETRQVVRVRVEGDTPKTRVLVEHLPAEELPPDRPAKLSSVNVFLERVQQMAPASASAVARIVDRFQQLESTDGGQFAFGLQAASANLYWKSTSGGLRRILSVTDSGRFRVLLGYLRGDGRTDLTEAIRQLAQPVIAIAPEQGSGALFVNHANIDAILALVDSVAEAFADSRS